MATRRRLGRLVHKADFQQLLATPALCRSAHFAAHHRRLTDVAATPPADVSPERGLSTATEHDREPAVDKMRAQHWFGVVLPKRWARRAVTRNLLRRLLRTEMEGRLCRLPPGQWLFRLRAAWSRDAYRSASSVALRHDVRREIGALFDRLERTPC